ncbi:uncharacterized protein LOC127767747 [Oryza glaberrima]|uniref:Uncharacterized protein n=1 Tax=Oryza glaberrima TaxID=4538 RepID=I1PFW4_ORYGL|nr:uncharacterized protein LOC127767747 [Oryza glaberrima]
MSRGRSRLSWLWRAPARALGRARDMYVRGMTGCARCVPADAAFGYPVFVPSSAAASMRSNSFGSDSRFGGGADDDLRELIRAASQRRAAEQEREARAVARSQSMASGISMARIDEDAPCEEFGGAGVMHFPRSQSCVGGVGGRIAHCHRKVAALA